MTLLNNIHQWVPLHTHRKSTFPAWVNNKFKNLLAKKKRIHKLYKITGNPIHYNKFSNLRAQYKFESKRLYRRHIDNLQEGFCKNPRSYWAFIRNLKGGNSIPHLVYYESEKASDTQVPSAFASFFSSVYRNPIKLSTPSLDTYTSDQFTFFPSSISISLAEVHSALNSLSSTRGSGPDGIAASFLYLFRDFLYLPLCFIFNISLSEGVFPSIWKISRVSPILKSGNPANVSNYRPISCLPFLGKIFEHIVLGQIRRPLLSTISTDQHGFFPCRSTVTCSVDFITFLHEAFERNQQVDVIYTDFSKAFDSIDHGSFIYILDRLGIGNPFLSWLGSYLSGRRQFVSLFGNSSDPFEVPSGVPQGSHLGPLLFNIFINTIHSSLSPCRILLYADDAKMFYSISTNDDCLILQSALNELSSWCNIVGLSLNTDKFKIMTFHRIRSILSFDYYLNGSPLERVFQINDLGFLYSPSLDFRPHIDQVIGNASRALGFIRRHSSNFDHPKCLLSLYTALVRSILEYGTVVWSPYTALDKTRINRVQNRFLSFAGYNLKIIHPAHDYSPVNEIFRLES